MTEKLAMVKLHPNILYKDGKEQFVILPYEEFLALQKLLEDAEDLLDLRHAKRENAGQSTSPLDEVKKRLNLEDS